MSVSSDRGQEDAGVDLQEAKMSFPKLVRRQTANIPPGERAVEDLSHSNIHLNYLFHLWQPIPKSNLIFMSNPSKIQVHFHPPESHLNPV